MVTCTSALDIYARDSETRQDKTRQCACVFIRRTIRQCFSGFAAGASNNKNMAEDDE